MRARGLKDSKFGSKNFKSLSAFGWALLLETALIAGGIYWLVAHPVQPPDKVIPITIESIAPEIEKPPEPVKPKPPEPPPKPVLPPPIQPPLPQPKVSPPPTVQPPVDRQAPAIQPAVPAAPVLASPPPAPAPVAALAPPPPPPLAAPSPDIQAAYASKVKAAAQAALEVPGTVAALRFKGRTRVGFSLRDGVATNVAVVQTSGLGAMDRAATKAVQSASYPAPPAALQGKEVAYEVWVTVEPTN